MTDQWFSFKEGKSSSRYYRHKLAQAAGVMAAEMYLINIPYVPNSQNDIERLLDIISTKRVNKGK